MLFSCLGKRQKSLFVLDIATLTGLRKAVSGNGLSYSKYPWNPVLDLRASGKSDDNGVAIHCSSQIEDKFHAIFFGHDGSKWQLGYLTLE